MKDQLLNLAIRLQILMKSEEGQDLIEYALLAAIIALGATVGMSTVAGDINRAFDSIGSKLLSYT